MTQQNSRDSDRSPERDERRYATQIPSFGNDIDPSMPPGDSTDQVAPVKGQSADPEPPALRTQFAIPVHQQEISAPHAGKPLPSQVSFEAVGKTCRADPIQIHRLAQTANGDARQSGISQQVLASRIRSINETEKTLVPTQRSGDAAQLIGKSTWDLRIHRRDVQGQISGIVNPIPASGEATTGLQSALAVDDDAPEYEVLSQLGAGNMGIVYHARQLSLNRELAIKTLKPSSRQAQHDQAMFVSEAVVTANLVHPNIIPIHDLGRTGDGKLFYSMKKVSGVPWNKIIRERSLEENLDIFMKFSDAVAYAHSRGVINRDLKPENVVIGEYGEVVVLDWGLAITTELFEKRRSVLVDFRGGAGTPVYMAPELLDDNLSRVGPQSDIYLLGAILFEILEGFPPHLLHRFWHLTRPEEQFDAVYRAVMYNEIEDDVTHHGELMQIARKAMSTEPGDRYSSVEAMQNAIREYRITGRAEELMNSIDSSPVTDYTPYQSAVALYSEALLKWPDNRRALNGDRNARLAYARLAQKKGDIDLGLQVVANQTAPEFFPVIAKLKETRLIRSVVRGTWGVMTFAAVSLMIVSLAAYFNIQEKNVEIVAQNAEITAKNGQLDEVNRKVRDAGIELEKADRRVDEANNKVAEADKQVEEANKKVVEADNRLVDANKKVGEAEDRVKKADDKLAETESELNQTTIQLAMAAEQQKDAVEARDAALKERDRLELEAYKNQIETALQLSEFDKVILFANQALEKAKGNNQIREQEDVLRKQLKAAEEIQGNAQIPLPDPPTSASISADGRTVVIYSDGVEGKSVVVFRNPGENRENRPTPLRIPVTVKGSIKVAVSDDGRCFCLASASEKQFWQLQNERYEQLTPKDNAQFEPIESVGKIFFSPDGRHFYVIGNDRHATIDIYSLSFGTSELLWQQQLSGGATIDFRIRDAVLLPDESALIVQFVSQPCFEFRMNWSKDGKPEFDPDRLSRNALKLRLDVAALGLKSGQPEKLFVSPDGQRLGLKLRDTVVFLPRVSGPAADRFSFATPEESADFEILKATYPIDEVRFSGSDSQRRIATGHGTKFLQIWDLQGRKYEACKVNGLYEHRLLSGEVAACLRGHSKEVKAFAFAGDDGDHLVSVSADESIRIWQISTYAELIAQIKKVRETFDAVLRLLSARLERPATGNKAAGIADRFRNTESVTARSPVREFPEYTLTAGPLPQPPAITSPIRIQQGQTVYSARFSPDAKTFLIGANDLAAHAFDSRTGQEIMTAPMDRSGRRDLLFDPSRNMFLEGHVSEISAIRFLPPDGALVLSADYFGSISVWDAVPDDNGAGFERSRLLSEYSFSEFAVSEDGTLILAGGASTVNPDSKLGETRLLHKGLLWRTEDILRSPGPEPFRKFEDHHPDFAITAVGISPASAVAVTAGRRGKIVVWNIDDGSVIAEIDDQHNRDQVAGIFFENETQLVSAGYDGRVIRSTVSGTSITAEEIKRSTGDTPSFIIRLRPSPDRQRFATSEVSLANGVNNVNSGRLNITIWSNDGSTRALLEHPIIIPDDDRKVAFRHDVSWSSDGREFMLLHNGVIAIYDTVDWKLLRKFKNDELGARPVRGAFSPSAEGRSDRIATFDGRVMHLWDLQQDGTGGLHVAEFRSHASYSVTASWSSDEKYVATASETLRVFDSDPGSPNYGSTVYRLPVGIPHKRPLSDTSFSPVPGDSRLATIDDDGTLAVWQWDPGAQKPLTPVFDAVPGHKGSPDWAPGQKFKNVAVWNRNGKSLVSLQSGLILNLKIEDGIPKIIEVPLPKGLQCRFNQLHFSEENPLLTAGGVAWNETTGEMFSFAAVWDVSNDLPRLIATIDKSGRNHSVETEGTLQKGITAIAFNDRENEIVTGGADQRLIRWQLRADDESIPSLSYIYEMKGPDNENAHEAMITALDVSPTGQILTADDTGQIILWPAPKN